MITLLVGHRGVGKSQLLKTMIGLATCLDLDQEIERRTGLTISHLIGQSETEFRLTEMRVLNQLVAEASGETVIAVGAGCEGPMPEGAHVIWIRRGTDVAGRSFLNRPRLDAELWPLAEYLQRHPSREERFQAWAHEELTLPEGYDHGLEIFFTGETLFLGGDLTLLPENFRDWSRFIHRRKPRLWEVRDDLLSKEQVDLALATLPRERILYSRRSPNGDAPEEDIKLDWALELGEPPSDIFSLSLHEREGDFLATLEKMNTFRAPVLKLAVEVKDFAELRQGHEWWKQDPKARSFLPRSTDGRWRWYRSLWGPSMPLHFIREGGGSALDQPLLWQALLQPPFAGKFCAVLGHPVEHSRSPWEHLYTEKDIPFVAINLREDESPAALKLLLELGLRFAAVTAPLKKIAWAMSDVPSPRARQLKSANSLKVVNEKVHAENTDVLALLRLRQQLKDFHDVWLWGGGGVKSSVREAWPGITEISSRQGTTRERSPDLLIWAVGRGREFRWPPAHVRPKLILDLNYADDSPGLEWAVHQNLPYQSGLRMFKLQAEFQRQFWLRPEKGFHP